ncbi:MAG: hypothetical protein QOF90_1425 [Acetobacteraceae bacterium]|nr:hypothetical protein [Acetobacteraceae bacterium]
MRQLLQKVIAKCGAFPILVGFPALLWPALWNGYPIVFADTGTYLSQAIHRYAGWDRPVFYSLFLLPLHGTLTLWPVVVVQASLTAWILWLVCRTLLPNPSVVAFASGLAFLSACTWLPWIVGEVMPDLFTPLLVLVICLLSAVPERLSQRERMVVAALATFMIASQQSSLPLAGILLVVLGGPSIWWGEKAPAHERRIAAASSVPVTPSPRQRFWSRGIDATLASPSLPANRRRLLLALPPILAILGLCTANLAAHGRFAISPFGNIFLLARVIYDGPGMTTLRRDCPTSNWRLCEYIDRFPPTSDEFLWSTDSPLYLAGGPKIVSDDAGAIIQAALISDPAGEAQAAIRNMLEQLRRFDSGDGLEPWPAQVSPWIQRDLPAAEQAAYASARQQTGRLTVPKFLATTHQATALAGVAGTMLLLPIALRRRAPCARFLLAVLLALPISAAITGGLSAPHDRYQSRIMWLPPFIAVVSLMALLRPRE